MEPQRKTVTTRRRRKDDPREDAAKDAQPSPIPPPPPPPPRDDCSKDDWREVIQKEPKKNLDPTAAPPPTEGKPVYAGRNAEPLVYLEFRLRIGQGKGGYEVEVQQAPTGSGTARTELPCDVDEVESYLKGLRDQLKERRGLDLAKEVDARVGEKVFSAVFSGDVLRSFENSVSGLRGYAASSGKEHGLRIRLQADTPKDLLSVGAQPWEFAYDARQGGFAGRVACERLTPVVRCLDAPRFLPPLEVVPPYRILVVDCVPEDQNPLETEEERSELRIAIEHAKVARVVPLINPTVSELRRHLLRFRPHILHFIGHGDIDDVRGEGYLCLVDEDGKTDRLRGEELGQMLSAASSSLRLVFLNSCLTAKFPRYQGQDPWSATAAAILRAGVPAVIAMQFSILNSAATAFSTGFYRALREGDPLEAAVVEGRVEVQRSSAPWQWSIPVLYLNTQDGELFKPPAAIVAGSRDEAPPLKLGIRSFLGWGRDMKARVAQMLALDSYFDDRFIRSPELWTERVAPKLSRFLKRWVQGDRPVELELAAHQTLAFLTGYLLDAKGGIELRLIQRSEGQKPQPWTKDSGEIPPDPLWTIEEKTLGTPEGDVAVAIGITHKVRADVEHYLEKHRIPVGRLISLELPGGFGHEVVKSGAHANALAQKVYNLMDERHPDEKCRTLHILGSAPNGFFVYLGRKARGFGAIQLYEYDLEKTGHKTYQPSLRLPLGKA